MLKLLKIELNPNRVFGLDILRTLAILFVVIDHGTELLPEALQPFSRLFRFDGVSIFFVLSGFLIGGILIKLLENNRASASLLFDFWKRRWFRTLPNYFLILILLIFLDIAFSEHPYSFKILAPYFVFAQNINEPHPWFFPEAWSLSIEEWFYITVPVLIFILVRALRLSVQKAILYTALLIIIIVIGIRYYKYLNHPFDDIQYWDLNFRKIVITRFDSLMFGILGAYMQFYHFQAWIKNKKTLLIIGIIILLCARVMPKIVTPDSVYSCVFSFVSISVGVLLTLPFLSGLKSGKGVLYKAITYISLTSYSIYLIHYSVIKYWVVDRIIGFYLPQNTLIFGLFKYGIFLSLTMIFSILLYKYFEVPTTNLREKK